MRLIISFLLLFNSVFLYAQNIKSGEAKKAIKPDSLCTYEPIESNYEAYGREENSNPDEAGHSENKPLKTENKFYQSGFYLVLDSTKKVVNEDSIFCHELFVVNKSDSSMSFSTELGALDLMAEALNSDGKWIDIEYRTYSTCGNSIYSIVLDTNEFWHFLAPIYKGKFKTKLRYAMWDSYIGNVYYSNEITVWINKEQFGNKAERKASLYKRGPLSNNGSQAVVSAVEFNVVYIGIDNELAIAVPSYSSKQIVVTTSLGKLIKSKYPAHYILRLDSVTHNLKELEISVFVKGGKSGRLTKKADHRFRIRKIPLPTITLGGIDESGTYSVGRIASSGWIGSPIYNIALEGIHYKVTKYAITIRTKTGSEKQYEGIGSAIAKEIENALRGLKSGDKVILSNVQVSGPYGLVNMKDTLDLEVR